MILNHKTLGSGSSTIVILHGLFGSLDNWLTFAKNLAEHRQVVLMDLRNHGNSPHADEWNYSLMARDVKETLDHLNIRHCFLSGHSMGGKTAMVFSELYPEYLQGLIVIDIGPRYYEPHHQTILRALFAVTQTPVHSRKEAEERITPHIQDAATRQFLLKNLYWRDPQNLDWKFNLTAIAVNIEEVGKATPDSTVRIPVHTLFIKGGNSDYLNTSDTEKIKKIFPNSQLSTIENAGHWVHAEKPIELLETIKTWINEQETS